MVVYSPCRARSYLSNKRRPGTRKPTHPDACGASRPGGVSGSSPGPSGAHRPSDGDAFDRERWDENGTFLRTISSRSAAFYLF